MYTSKKEAKRNEKKIENKKKNTKKKVKDLDTRIRTKDQQITTVTTTVCRSTGLSYVELTFACAKFSPSEGHKGLYSVLHMITHPFPGRTPRPYGVIFKPPLYQK